MISPAIHYEKVFNATDKYIDYYRDAPHDSGIPVSEDTQNLVMHAGMTICGTHINMCDTQDKIIAGNMIFLNAFFESVDEVCNAFHMLKKGGKVYVELGPQFFSSMYGSLEDRFGIRWQLIAN